MMLEAPQDMMPAPPPDDEGGGCIRWQPTIKLSDLSAEYHEQLKVIDRNNDGIITIEEIVEELTAHKRDSEKLEVAEAELVRNAGEAMKEGKPMQIHFDHLSDEDKKFVEEWDSDHNGVLSISELIGAVKKHRSVVAHAAYLRKVVGVLLIALIILCVAMFLVTLAAVELAKDMKPTNGKLATKEGHTLATTSIKTSLDLGTLHRQPMSTVRSLKEVTLQMSGGRMRYYSIQGATKYDTQLLLQTPVGDKVKITDDSITIVAADGSVEVVESAAERRLSVTHRELGKNKKKPKSKIKTEALIEQMLVEGNSYEEKECKDLPVDCASLNRKPCETSLTDNTCGPCLCRYFVPEGGGADWGRAEGNTRCELIPYFPIDTAQYSKIQERMVFEIVKPENATFSMQDFQNRVKLLGHRITHSRGMDGPDNCWGGFRPSCQWEDGRTGVTLNDKLTPGVAPDRTADNKVEWDNVFTHNDKYSACWSPDGGVNWLEMTPPDDELRKSDGRAKSLDKRLDYLKENPDGGKGEKLGIQWLINMDVRKCQMYKVTRLRYSKCEEDTLVCANPCVFEGKDLKNQKDVDWAIADYGPEAVEQINGKTYWKCPGRCLDWRNGMEERVRLIFGESRKEGCVHSKGNRYRHSCVAMKIPQLCNETLPIEDDALCQSWCEDQGFQYSHYTATRDYLDETNDGERDNFLTCRCGAGNLTSGKWNDTAHLVTRRCEPDCLIPPPFIGDQVLYSDPGCTSCGSLAITKQEKNFGFTAICATEFNGLVVIPDDTEMVLDSTMGRPDCSSDEDPVELHFKAGLKVDGRLKVMDNNLRLKIITPFLIVGGQLLVGAQEGANAFGGFLHIHLDQVGSMMGATNVVDFGHGPMDIGPKAVLVLECGYLQLYGQTPARLWSRVDVAQTEAGLDSGNATNVVYLEAKSSGVPFAAGDGVVFAPVLPGDPESNPKRTSSTVEDISYGVAAAGSGENRVVLEENVTWDRLTYIVGHNGERRGTEVGLLQKYHVVINAAVTYSTADTTPCQAPEEATGKPISIGGYIAAVRPCRPIHIIGVKLEDMGQETKRGRYAVHLHMACRYASTKEGTCQGSENGMNDIKIARNYFKRTFNRCVTVHGTDFAKIEGNIAIDITGHCLMVEDGIEEKNEFVDNLMLISKKPVDTFCSGGAVEDDIGNRGLIWLNNPNNLLKGNAMVSGGAKCVVIALRHGTRGEHCHRLRLKGKKWSPAGTEITFNPVHEDNTCHHSNRGLRIYPQWNSFKGGERPKPVLKGWQVAHAQRCITLKHTKGIKIVDSHLSFCNKWELICVRDCLDNDILSTKLLGYQYLRADCNTDPVTGYTMPGTCVAGSALKAYKYMADGWDWNGDAEQKNQSLGTRCDRCQLISGAGRSACIDRGGMRACPNCDADDSKPCGRDFHGGTAKFGVCFDDSVFFVEPENKEFCKGGIDLPFIAG